MTRDEELAKQATRVQHRPGGLIVDYWGCGPFVRERQGEEPLIGDRRLALVRCVHGKEWPESDCFEGHGGSACAECCCGGSRV